MTTARTRLLFELVLAIFWLTMWEACRVLATPTVPGFETERFKLNISQVSGGVRELTEPRADLFTPIKRVISGESDGNNNDEDHDLSSTVEISNAIDEWVAPKEFTQWFSYYLSGYDYDGSPVYIFDYGRWNPVEALRKTPGGREKAREIVTKYMLQGIHRILQQGRENNDQGVAVIIDYEGFNLGNYADTTAIQMLLKLWSYFDRIHSVLNYAFIINTNFAAENFIRLMKPLWGNILEKCEVFGTRKSQWLPQILRQIPKSELPPWLGGNQDWRPIWIGGTGKAVAPTNSSSSL